MSCVSYRDWPRLSETVHQQDIQNTIPIADCGGEGLQERNYGEKLRISCGSQRSMSKTVLREDAQNYGGNYNMKYCRDELLPEIRNLAEVSEA